MSLDKAIEHGHEHRKPYRGSKRFDKSCRPHGNCAYCYNSRTRWRRTFREVVEDNIKEWMDADQTAGFPASKCYGNMHHRQPQG